MAESHIVRSTRAVITKLVGNIIPGVQASVQRLGIDDIFSILDRVFGLISNCGFGPSQPPAREVAQRMKASVRGEDEEYRERHEQAHRKAAKEQIRMSHPSIAGIPKRRHRRAARNELRADVAARAFQAMEETARETDEDDLAAMIEERRAA